MSDKQSDSGFGSSITRRILGDGPGGDGWSRRATDRLLAESASGMRRAGNLIRVRLLVAVPVIMVLLVTLVGFIMYQVADAFIEQQGHVRDPDKLLKFARLYLWLLCGFVVIAAVVGTVLAYTITRPVRQLISMSARVAGGDFSTKMETSHRHDEMGALGWSFNKMVDSLNTFISTRNKLILESFSGGLITTDVGGTVTAVNSAAERMLHIRASDAVGGSLSDVMKRGDAEPVAGIAERALWSGEPVIAQTVELPVGVDGQKQELSVTCSPMRDADGQVFGLIVNLRSRAEMRRFYEQMNRADRLATLGTFAAGLAHEVRNPLGAIKGTAQLLAEDVRDMPRTSQYAQVIVKEVNRLDRLVREVQEFSAPGTELRRPTDISKLARETLALARTRPEAADGESVEVREQYALVPRTVVSREKLTMAVLNILLNAFQATPPGGEVSVVTEYVDGDPLPLRLSISNTGSRIDGEAKPRIFEPFYTTKEAGTGLGLSIAYQVARHHGGELELENDDDPVKFTFRLPLVAHDADEPTR